jgi:ligand-binding sensor domain-containing protein/anti-sigma regulatory factor (Ser/Thr protein kinase)
MSVLCLLFSTLLFAQPYEYAGKTDRFTTKDGLPHNTISSLAQDQTGFLWIGTANGLCRYDGIRFLEVSVPVQQENHWEQVIETLYEDRLQRLWYASRSGSIGFKNKENQWKYVGKVPEQGDFASCFFMDQRERVWIGTNNGHIGFCTTNGDGIKWIKQVNPELRFLFLDKKEKLWLASYEIQILDIKTLNLSSPPEYNRLKRAGFWAAKMNNEGGVLMTKKDSSFIFNSPKEIKAKEFIWHLGKSVKSRTIDGVEAEVYKLSVEQNDFIINELLKDQSGLIWVATNDGLMKLDRKRYRFKSYSTHPADFALNSNYVRALNFLDSSIWLGFKQAPISQLKLNGNNASPDSYGLQDYDGAMLYQPTVNAIIRNKKGEIWAAGLEGLFKLNPEKGVFESVPLRTKTGKVIIPLESWALCEDSAGRLWLGGKQLGLWVVEQDGSATQVNLPGDKTPVWDIYCSPSGEFWVGTNAGLFQLRESKNFTFEVLPVNDLKGASVWDIKSNKAGEFFIATTNGGFYIYNPFTRETKKYTKKEGLPSNSVCSIQEDTLGRVWLGTANGLCCLDYHTNELTNYYEQDGLVSNDFNFGVSAKSLRGELFYGTKNGMISFKPVVKEKHQSPDISLVINSFTANGEEVSNGQAGASRRMFSHDKNTMSFGFALLEYSHPKKHIYQYKLEPFDEEWRSIQGEPFVNYTKLPPNKYTFQVRASANGKHWYTNDGLAFSIKAAIWQRQWFYPSLVLLILSLLLGFLYYRLRLKAIQQQRKSELEKRVARLELKALQAQMNPHFIFNAVNSVQHFMLKDDLLAANEYLTQFALLMRFSLEASIKRQLPLKEEVEMLQLYVRLQALRFDFKFELTAPAEEEMERITIPALLIQPFVENAIEHGLATKEGDKCLKLEIFHKHGELRICVEDNGIGREKAKLLKNTFNQKRKSRGMQLMKERVEVYQATDEGKLSVEIVDKQDKNQKSTGTKVIIICALKNSI